MESSRRHKVLAEGGWGNWLVRPSQKRGMTPEEGKGNSPGEQTSEGRRPRGYAHGLGMVESSVWPSDLSMRPVKSTWRQTHVQSVIARTISA